MRHDGRSPGDENAGRPPEAKAKVADMAVRAETAEARAANSYQPGGDHYVKHGANGEQHWDRMWRLFGPAWFIGNITKYAERAHEKNGVEDLEKVIHYATKYKELFAAYLAGTGVAPGHVNLGKVQAKAAVAKATDNVRRNAGPASLRPGELITASNCPHPDTSRVLIQTVAGNGWRCDLCGHKESN